MGDADTLADFLKWGVDSCPAAKMGVILWNHGGGSISGVSFDELSYGDSLSLTEINSALSEVSGSMTNKFEFIGFDACLMGTVETANILASYSRYMYGSEETEPRYGWDYAAIGNYLGEDPSADGAMLGRIVCDSFYEGCEEIGLDSGATLSVIDLSVIDDVIISFNDYAKALYEASEDGAVLAEVIRSVNNADNYGGNIVTVVIDNVNSIESNDMRNEIKALCGNKKLWVIILGRSRMPSWLYDTFITRNMRLVTQEELALSEEGIDKYMRSEGIILTADELRFHRQCSEGNLYGVKFTAQQLLAGDRIGKELFEKNSAMFQSYLENSIISELNTEISDFLLKVCIVDDFTEPLAKTITGNSAALSLIERTLDSGHFIDNKDGVYTLHPQMLNALRKKAVKELSENELHHYAILAGGYYEQSGEDDKALNLYAKYNESARIRELLIRNSRKNPESGYYVEMRRYYLMLSDADIESNVYLMSAMSMLYSMLLDFDKSEYWYKKLTEYRDKAKGSVRREATRQIVYLDISLPGRGSLNILELIKNCYALLSDKSIPFPEFSVTSNQPSLMNGGKDF